MTGNAVAVVMRSGNSGRDGVRIGRERHMVENARRRRSSARIAQYGDLIDPRCIRNARRHSSCPGRDSRERKSTRDRIVGIEGHAMACRRRRTRRGKPCITLRLKHSKIFVNFALAFNAAVAVL